MIQTKNHTSPRLFINEPLAQGAQIHLSREQAHYAVNVMRCHAGDHVRLFNGRDGEWLGVIESTGKHQAVLGLTEQLRPQENEPDIWLVAAPIKNDRMHFLVEKATELGMAAMLPVFTAHTIGSRVNHEKLVRYAEEAAEQCERLTVPEIQQAVSLPELLKSWQPDRVMIVCDETGGGTPIGEVLASRLPGKYAVLIGPEGGFSKAELEQLRDLTYVVKVGLGPRILRADTAALAALVCLQSALGDWHRAPRFISK